MKHPCDIWGDVRAPLANAAGITAVRAERSPGGGYLLLPREGDNEFDIWLETEQEVEDYLDDLQVAWP